MGKTIPVDQLASTIMEGLEEYADLINEDMKADVKKAAETVKKEVKANAPVHSDDYPNRKRKPGTYKKSWRQKITKESGNVLEITVYSSQPGLTHLLEKGHAKRGGGRTRAFPHIAPAEQKGIDQLERDIERDIRKESS